MEEQLAALREAFEAAGIEVPADPAAIEPRDLDDLVPDKRLRGRCKAALVKYRRAAGPVEPAAVEETAGPAPEPAGTSDAQASEPAQSPAEPQPEEAAPSPMSEALQALHDDLVEAFGAAGIDAPADPLSYDLGGLNELVEDRKIRGRIKSAMVKFRRAAEAEGWSPPTREAAPAGDAEPPPAPTAPVATVPEASEEEPLPAAAVPSDVPAIPATDPSELWLLTPDGWQLLGTAARVPSALDEIVGGQIGGGAVGRVTSVLVLDGKFTVPEDIYNTHCYLAHEGRVYKCYYISHIGDVKRGTKTASLKVADVYDHEGFARAFVALGRRLRPSADDARHARFGRRYDAARDMFAEQRPRMV